MTSDDFLEQALPLVGYLINGLHLRGIRPVDAESIVLEVIAGIERRVHELPALDSVNLRNYLVRACRNKTIDTFERPMYREALRSRALNHNVGCPVPAPMSRDISQERCDAIKSAVAGAHKHGGLILDMMEQGHRHVDIAKVLGVTEARISQILGVIRERVSVVLDECLHG